MAPPSAPLTVWWASTDRGEPELRMGAQGFRMLLPPDELHTKLEYTGCTWNRTGTGLFITR